MSSSVTSGFRRLALITALLVYLLIVVGGIVRVTNSGLGCPDWPLCYGQVLPPPDQTAWIEFSHRFVAGLGGLFLLATAFFAWRGYRAQRWIAGPALAVIALLVIQVPLGAVVVLTELEALSVVVHLGMAFLIFASSILVSVAAYWPAGLADETPSPAFLRLLLATAVTLFLLVIVGALVVGSAASYACPDWPLCHGQLVPLDRGTPVLLHVLHRLTVVALGAFVLAALVTAYRHRTALPGTWRWAGVLGIMFALQVGVGAFKIWFQLPTVLRALHLAMAAAVWAVLIAMIALTYFARQRQAV